MSFASLPKATQAVRLLQRSLDRGRLGHAYLLVGEQVEELELMARTLAKTVNCLEPGHRAAKGMPLDSCDQCSSCRRIDLDNHPDVQWLRAESKSRVITIEQVRDLIHTMNLKPSEASFKLAIISGADRLNVQAANAFLKTLEEPPSRSILILLSTEPERLLDTIRSRCLRLFLAGGSRLDPAMKEWVAMFAEQVAHAEGGLLARYRLLGRFLGRLTSLKEGIEKDLTQRSPLERSSDLEVRTRERLEDELAAAIEAEYRRKRSDLFFALQLWLRDIWLFTLSASADLASLPHLQSFTSTVGQRLSSAQAARNFEIIEQTQRFLHSNVQEALALEVGLLRLKI